MSYLQINLVILAVAMVSLFAGVILSRVAGVGLKETVVYGLGWSCFIGIFDAVEVFMAL